MTAVSLFSGFAEFFFWILGIVLVCEHLTHSLDRMKKTKGVRQGILLIGILIVVGLGILGKIIFFPADHSPSANELRMGIAFMAVSGLICAFVFALIYSLTFKNSDPKVFGIKTDRLNQALTKLLHSTPGQILATSFLSFEALKGMLSVVFPEVFGHH